MIYFITNRTDHQVSPVSLGTENDIQFMTPHEAFDDLISYVDSFQIEELCYDVEATDLDPYKARLLLVAIGNQDRRYVFDKTSVDITTLLLDLNEKVTWIGQNLKYDYSITKTNIGIGLKSMYDTMIVEQRLYPNMDLKFDLVSIILRNLGSIPPAMNKDIRNEFIGVTPDTFIFYNRHITYSAGDIEILPKLKEIQSGVIKKYHMEFLLYNVEFPLIEVLAECELEGYDVNEQVVKELLQENTEKQFKLECKLDEIVRTFRDLQDKEDVKFIKGGKYDRVRKEKAVASPTIDLFGGETLPVKKTKSAKNNAFINYSSTPEIIALFARLKFPLPTTTDRKAVIPILDENNVLKNSYLGFTTQEKELQQFLIENPNHPSKEFIETLLEYREVTGELSKYGLSFLTKINAFTKRIHTRFRQCVAVNGRLQSGGKKEEPDKVNIQNFPRKKKIRNIIYRKGYSIVTCDLEGAEVTTMADKANDLKLFELAMKGDIHSHMCQLAWRRIYENRADKMDEINEEYDILVDLANTFVVSKTVNADSHRVPGKNLTFGSIYGCGANKAGRTINVSPTEGAIYINTIKSEIPLTFKMVEKNVKLAIKQGYLVLNKRTNSRVWFPTAMQAIREGRDLRYDEIHEVDGQARNIPISGTQADMVKEAMVEIHRGIKEQGVDCAIMFQVHDEIVARCPKNMDGQSDEWLKNPRPMAFFPDGRGGDFMAVSFPEFVKLTMCQCANRYLNNTNNIKMKAEVKVSESWTK